LYQLNPQSYARTQVAVNDDSAAGVNTAFIQYSVATNNFYDIIIGTSAGGETGAYTFAVSSSTTFSPHVAGSAPRAGGRGQGSWWRDVTIPKRSRR